MKRVLFYTQNRWAFGSIHYGLCKELYKHGIYGNVLDEDNQYSETEIQLLFKTYDLIVTNPDKVLHLHYTYKIPLSKIVAVAHAQWDILLAKNSNVDFYSELYSFGVISNFLKEKCKEWNISTIPKVVETGVHFDLFYAKPSQYLKVIGYGGIKQTYNFYKQEIKRGYLVDEVCSRIPDLELKQTGTINFLCMPGYYQTVDSVVMSSIEEGGGLPVMEAAAAGRLVLGTPVGYFEEHALKGGGILLPIDENNFKEELYKQLIHYKTNPNEYHNKCLQIQQHAKDNYDWAKKISMWLEIL
jgi:glycosyltransferase involved in cell wall biosynthesis